MAGVAVLFSLSGIGHATEVQSKPWGEFYGDQLEAALKAGRGVENAPQHEFPPLPEGVTARELLGLNSQFTKSQLRSAWLRLARELHPDRWTSAGQGVRQMKEAALKRVFPVEIKRLYKDGELEIVPIICQGTPRKVRPRGRTGIARECRMTMRISALR